VTKHLFKSLFSVLFFLLVLGGSLVGPEKTYAQDIPNISHFQNLDEFGISDCDPTNNPRSCSCVFVFRDTRTGEVINALRGTSDSDARNSGLIGIPNDVSTLEFATMVYEDTADKREDNCYSQQTRTTSSIEGQKLSAAMAAGCLAGVWAPGINIITCPAGSLLGGVLSGELQDLFTFAVRGAWQGAGNKGGNHTCTWYNDRYSISRWQRMTNGFDDDQVSRLEYRGHIGGAPILGDTFSPSDQFYCGLLVAKNLSNTITGPEDQLDRFDLCIQAGEPETVATCNQCFNNNGIWTAVGCIPRDPTGILQTIIRIGLTLGGGVALLAILGGAFVFSTSQGDPKKTGQAKEMITSAIIGLLFIIFSITILQFIGVTILQIPGFGGS
jgi:hypothetical protein